MSDPVWPTTNIDRVLFVAQTQVGVCETPPNSNAGPKVEEYQRVTGNKKGDPWCSSFVAYCGERALGSQWPLLRTGGCQALYEASEKKGLVKTAPAAGDVFLLWFPKLGRFAHTGFVVRASTDGKWVVREGNAAQSTGTREGWIVAEKERAFKPEDRFVRWAE